MVYKICLSSTHGTGKTSLAASIEGELKKHGIEARYLRETASEAKEIGLSINQHTTLEAQMYILHTQFAQELRYSSQHKNPPIYQVIICDRGPDNYCYLKHNLGENTYALNMTLGHLNSFPYNRIYLLPIIEEHIAIGSGARALDTEFQKHMDQEIRAFLKQHEISYIELPPPAEKDSFRHEWLNTIITQTLQDLKH